MAALNRELLVALSARHVRSTVTLNELLRLESERDPHCLTDAFPREFLRELKIARVDPHRDSAVSIEECYLGEQK